MRAAARTTAVALFAGVLIGSTFAGVGAARGATKRIKPEQPCTIVTKSQIEKAFGGPVADPTEGGVLLVCSWRVGTDPSTPPGGAFHARQVFPNIINTSPNAKAAIEDERAIDSLSDNDLRDVDNVGRSAYLNATTGEITVQANKRYVFEIAWNPGGLPATLNAKQEKALVKLAKSIVKRAPKS
jgi:hypothetical protein